MKSALAFVAFLFFLPLQEASAQFQVSVYADVNTSPDNIRYELLDGLVLAFINPVDACGGFAATTIPSVQAVVSGARSQEAAGGGKITVTFSIGGGDSSVNQLLESTAASAECRTRFADQVAQILTQNDLDGVDLDWEFPQTSSLGNYTLLVQALREAIGTKLLSIAIYDDAGNEDPSDHMTTDVIPYVDYYMVEAYLSPRNAAIDSWISPPFDLPPGKLRLGLAFFGDPDNGKSSLGYNQVLGTVQPAQASPCTDKVGIYAINGLRTTGELTRFAMTEQLGGITGWELGQDRTDSISLLNATTETARMWVDFVQWQPGTTYPVGTIVQDQGNLWLVKSPPSATQPEPGLTNPAFKQIELTQEWSDQDYYCGGDEVWFGGSVYRAIQDPPLSVTDLTPTKNSSLWKKLYAAALYSDSKTYKKGTRVYFNGSVYAANKKTRGQSPANASANWTPVVDAAAFDAGTTYAAGATVSYMGNEYVAITSSVGLNPVVATDFWRPATN